MTVRFLKRFVEDESGQFAAITAIVGIPLIMIAGFAVDINQAVRKRSNIAAALDSAALAAVIPADLNTVERENYAREMFTKNYTGTLTVNLDVTATRERVDMHATAKVPSLVGSIVGVNSLKVSKDSAAVITRSDVVCVMALDPKGKRAVEFRNFAKFSAPACSVQVNSTHSQALYSTLSLPPNARSFCVVGGSYGNFDPKVKHQCTPVKDPYENLIMPAENLPTIDLRDFSLASLCDRSNVSGDNTSEDLTGFPTEDEKKVISDVTLNPGIYCFGLKVDGANVKFNPGVYHMWGDLEFTSYADAWGDDVTIILKGTKNTLSIKNGAQVHLKAPSSGPTAGLVFWQEYVNVLDYVLGKKTPRPDKVTGTSEISSGGGLEIIGTAYFPTQKLRITSDSPVASQSPATSLIAYQIEFANRANMEVHVDHEKGGIPPILPRSDESARLIK